MDSAYIGEIRPVAFPFAPVGWALCQGQTMSIAQFNALFAVIGTFYGGDGKSTFKLPNLSGQAAVGTGQGPGLSQYNIGAVTGTETVTLTLNQLPAHLHQLNASLQVQTATASQSDPTGGFLASTINPQYSEGPGSGTMAPLAQGTTVPVGGSQPHSNMMPSLTINYIICLQGVFPVRS